MRRLLSVKLPAEAVQKMLETLQIRPRIRGAKMLRVVPKADGHVIVLNLHPVAVREEITLLTGEEEKRIVPGLDPHSFVIL